MEWQPIEIAPKDGTEILAACGERVIVIQWCDGWGEGVVTPRSGPCWAVSAEGAAILDEGWDTGTGAKLEPSSPPTHWQPLPEPPRDSDGSGEAGQTA